MKRLSIIMCLICACAVCPTAQAQVAKWIIRPVNSAIARMNNSHFKAWNSEKCGVFNNEGKQVVPFMADSITDFVNDIAVVLRTEKDRNRLLSVLHATGEIYPVREEVYVDKNPFVCDNALLTFNKKGKEVFIDLEGNKMRKAPSITHPEGQTVDELEFVTDGPVPFEVGGKYGYRTNYDVLLPAQFMEAYPFSAGYAIATDSTGRYGLLRLLKDDVTVAKSTGAREAPDYEHESIDFKVHVPIEFDNEVITLDCVPSSGAVIEEKSFMGGSERIIPAMLPRGNYQVNVLAGDLLLYATTIKATPKPKPKPTKKKTTTTTTTNVETTATKRGTVTASTVSSGAVNLFVGASSLRANAKDCASFTITVSNNGDAAVTTPLTVSGKGVVCGIHQVTVRPHSSKAVTATFTGVKSRESRAVTVKTNSRSTTKTVSLIPFFTEF